MKYIHLFLLVALSASAWAQTETNLAAFTKIETNAPITIQLVEGTSNKAAHTGGLKDFKFTTENGVLSIDHTGKDFTNKEPLKIYFTTLSAIELEGVTYVNTAEGTSIKSDAFSIECSGASKSDLHLNVKHLKVECVGASKITLSGTADTSIIELAGASKVYGADLKTKEMTLDAAGASYFNVNASNTLNIEASGATKGVYAGNPINKNIQVSGISNIVDVATGQNLKDERSSGDDTTRITVGKKKVIIIEEGDDLRVETEDEEDTEENPTDSKPSKKYELKKVYAGFELGMNQFTSPNLKFEMPKGYEYLDCNIGKSWFYGLNILEGDVQLVKNKLALTSGLGMQFQNLTFASNQVLKASGNTLAADSGLVPLSKNRLYTYNLNVPLMLKFAPRTKKDRNNFHIAVGVIGSFKAYSHVRTETSAAGYMVETKTKDDYNINPFHVTATARIGYGWLRAFANYDLTPYFKPNNGLNPDVRVFSAGLTLVPFQ